MSQVEGTNNSRPGEEDLPPTASFGGLEREPANWLCFFRAKTADSLHNPLL